MGRINKRRQFRYPKWRICTEGVTEAKYLKRVVQELNVEHLVDINCRKCTKSGCGCQHERLVDQVEKCCSHGQPYEKVYIVHDYDDAYIDDRKKESFSRAYFRTDVVHRIEFNIPCFEYWLLLHRNDIKSDITHVEMCKKFKESFGEYLNSAGKQVPEGDGYKSSDEIWEFIGKLSKYENAKSNSSLKFKENEFMESVQQLQKRNCVSDAEIVKLFDGMRPSTSMHLLIDDLFRLSERVNCK